MDDGGAAIDDGIVDDAVTDDADSVSESVDSGLGELQQALEEAQGQLDDSRQAVLLAQAEQENLRKRTVRDIEKARKFALEGFAKELLPVKDSLELGLAAAVEVDGGHEQVIEGMELTLNLLAAALEKQHVRELNPLGQPFDPEHHQAMATQSSDQYEPNTVMMVYQKGYLLHDRLIRPAMVVVAKA